MIYAPQDAVGPYRISRLLGQGGMGEVYFADDTRLLRRVALKALTGPAPVVDLLREARMAARLQHPNIAVVYDVVEANGRLHIAMEYLEGTTLAQRLEGGASFRAEDVCALMAQVLRGVDHAHAAGVLHCDLKPANIAVLPNGDVKVLDFGLARLEFASTHSQSTLRFAGTPGYMAPERLRGAPPTQQADIFSLGVLLREMLNAVDAASDGTTQTAPGSALTARLRAAAEQAAADEPGRRFATAAAMLRAVEAAPTRRTFSVRAVALAGAALAILTMSASLWLRSPAREGHPRQATVVAIALGAAGGDPLAGHVAAALEALLRASFRSGTVTVAGSADAGHGTSVGEFRISGIVSRNDQAIALQLHVASPQGHAIASGLVQGSLNDLPSLGTALARGVDDVLRQAGLATEASSFDAADVRRRLTVTPAAFEAYAQAREYMRSSENAGGLDQAVRLLERALAIEPEFALAHAALAEAYWQKYSETRDDRWTGKARGAALDAIRLLPNDSEVRYTLALIYRGGGRTADAMQEVSKAIELNPASDAAYRLRGQLEADGGHIDRALADLAIAQRLRPSYWETPRTAGLILYGAGRYDDAIAQMTRVVELRPTWASAHQTLGTAYHAAGRIPEAVAAYERALALAPNANTYANLAKLHYDAGRFDQALSAYREAVRLRPKEPVTYRNLGDTHRRLGDTRAANSAYTRAIELADEALKVNPVDLAALSLQAICHAKLGHATDAVVLARRVLQAAAPPPIVYRAGVAMVIAGDAAGVDAVARALDAGFSLSEARLDPDLAGVWQDPKLAARAGASDTSRD